MWCSGHTKCKYKYSGGCCQYTEWHVCCFAHSWMTWAGFWHFGMCDWVVIFLTCLNCVFIFLSAGERWLACHELPGFLPSNLLGLLQTQARERKKTEDGWCQTFLQNQWHSQRGSLCLNWCFKYNLPCTCSYHIRGLYLWSKPGFLSPGSASLCSSLEWGLNIMTELFSDVRQEETSHSFLQNTGQFSFLERPHRYCVLNYPLIALSSGRASA